MAFRLQRLLNLYQRQEEHCILLYQEALAQQNKAEQQVYALEQELAAAGQYSGNADGDRLQQLWVYRKRVGEQLATARSALTIAQAKSERARNELLAARQQRKTLESLREKYLAAERQEQTRREQVGLDEAGLRVYQAGVEG